MKAQQIVIWENGGFSVGQFKPLLPPLFGLTGFLLEIPPDHIQKIVECHIETEQMNHTNYENIHFTSKLLKINDFYHTYNPLAF